MITPDELETEFIDAVFKKDYDLCKRILDLGYYKILEDEGNKIYGMGSIFVFPRGQMYYYTTNPQDHIDALEFLINTLGLTIVHGESPMIEDDQ